jgi:hypothetical protein
MLPKGGIGAEIGVFTGLFSTVLLEIARPKKIYFVDPWWKAYGRNYPDWGRYTDYGRLSTKAAYEIALRRTASHSRGAVVDIQVDRSQAFLPRMPVAILTGPTLTQLTRTRTQRPNLGCSDRK